MFSKSGIVCISIIISFFNIFGYKGAFCAPTEEDSNQQISDFSLAGYGEKGKKTWDLSGTTADIFDEVIALKKLTGNLYGDKEDMRLTADKGTFNKNTGKVHIEKNVVMTTSSGSKLTTDSLDWDRTNQVISTDAELNIEKGEMFTNGTGAWGRPDLNVMTLKKDITLIIRPEKKEGAQQQGEDEKQETVIVTCDGPLQVDYAKNVATFNRHVKVDRGDSQIFCDAMDIYFTSKKEKETPEKNAAQAAGNSMFMGANINKIMARGNVRTVRGADITYSQEAVYSAHDKKLTLLGRPMLMIAASGGLPGLGAKAE